MGRPAWSDRDIIEDCRSIDISWLKEQGYFFGYKSGGIEWRNSFGEITCSIGIQVSVDDSYGEKYVKLIYSHTNTHTDETTDLDYKVNLVTAPCNFGGARYWFICPLITDGLPCGRRVGKLYLPPGGKYFGCRHCYNLTYRSQKEHDKRVDALLKNPLLLMSQLQSKSSRSVLPAIKAFFKVIEDI